MPISTALLPGIPLVESPLFAASVAEAELSEAEVAIACSLHDRGVAVIDFPDADFDDRAERIKTRLAPHFGIAGDDPATVANVADCRIQDAWKTDADVKAIAINPGILALLGKLYGRAAVPFQTLNFPVGTQQHAHSDSNHFSSLPERFMCGVWVALEDIHPDGGPLIYYPGSHKWPIVTNAMIGRSGWREKRESAQAPFEAVWRAMLAEAGVQPETFVPRKGQAVIWMANLLHGGGPRIDLEKTRWSQVTHYYFEDCIYYTPAFSDEPLGLLDTRMITNIATGDIAPNRLLGEDYVPPMAALPRTQGKQPGSPWRKLFKHPEKTRVDGLPNDFDTAEYCRLNPDVAAAGVDPAEHFLKHGRREGRSYQAG